MQLGDGHAGNNNIRRLAFGVIAIADAADTFIVLWAAACRVDFDWPADAIAQGLKAKHKFDVHVVISAAALAGKFRAVKVFGNVSHSR